MKRLTIIAGLTMMTTGTGYMLHYNNAPRYNINPNTMAIATGGFFVAFGLSYRF
jgi:hypothetical protein